MPQPARQYAPVFSGRFEKTQITVGEHNLAIQNNGTLVLPKEALPPPRRRPPPCRRLPRDPVDLLGRARDLQRLTGALQTPTTIAFYGNPGVGKTALTKHVAAHLGGGWPDGVAFRPIGGWEPEDVLQWLFEQFWDASGGHYVPGPRQVGRYLEEVRALVVLDDVELEQADVEAIVDSAPSCAFVLGAEQPPLAPEHSRPLSGLEPDAARALFVRIAGPGDEDAVEAFVAQVEHLPGFVVTGAEMVRDGICSARDLIGQPGAVLARRRLNALPERQQRLVALLAELAPAAVPAAWLGPDARADLEALRHDGITQRHSPRYSLAGPYDEKAVEGLPSAGVAGILKHLTAHARDLVPDDAPAATAALARDARAEHHERVASTARLLAPAMVRAGMTGAWRRVAEVGATAAERHGTAADRAFFLHEQGTRLGCLGDLDGADALLHEALELRRHSGDDEATAVTQHNINAFFGGGGAVVPPNGGGGGGWPFSRVMAVLIVAVVAGIVGAVIALGKDDPSDPDHAETATTTTAPRGSDPKPPATTISRPPNGQTITAKPGGGSQTDPGPPPQITITSPQNGQTYPSGTVIRAEYSCKHADSCDGDVKPGVPVNGRPGTHPFGVKATAAGHPSAHDTVTYTIAAPPQSDPLVITVDPESSTAGKPITVKYDCSGGTPPIDCKGLLDGAEVARSFTIKCETHTLDVHATDAANVIKDVTHTYTVHMQCPEPG